MTGSISLQLAQRGVLTLPKALRDQYNLQPGDHLTLIDMDGIFLLSPRHSQVDYLADQISGALLEQGDSLEAMLAVLREERERYDSEA